MHIYESQGFKAEGLLKEQFYTKGKYKVAYITSLLKSEYFFSIKLTPPIHLGGVNFHKYLIVLWKYLS